MCEKPETGKFVINIGGCICTSGKNDCKGGASFAWQCLLGLKDVINAKLNELRLGITRSSFFSITIEEKVTRWYWIEHESFDDFTKRIKPEIFEIIKQAIYSWWATEPLDNSGPSSAETFDPAKQYTLLSNISAPPYDVPLAKLPIFSVEFGSYPVEFDGFRRTDDAKCRTVYWGDSRKTRVEYFRDKSQTAEDFLDFMRTEIPKLAELARRLAINNFNMDIRFLAFDRRSAPLSGASWHINTTANEFGDWVRNQVETVLVAEIEFDLKATLAEEDSFIEAEVDQNFGANIPPLPLERHYEELLKKVPDWFLK